MGATANGGHPRRSKGLPVTTPAGSLTLSPQGSTFEATARALRRFARASPLIRASS